MRIKEIILVVAILAFAPLAYGAEATTITSTSVNVAATSTRVASSIGKLVVLQNTSDTPIWCNIAGGTAVVGEGFGLDQIPASGRPGGAFGLDVVVPGGDINCIHGSTGNKVLNVMVGR